MIFPVPRVASSSLCCHVMQRGSIASLHGASYYTRSLIVRSIGRGYQVFQVSMGHPSLLFIKLNLISISCCCPFFCLLVRHVPLLLRFFHSGPLRILRWLLSGEARVALFRVGSPWSMSTLTPSPGFEFDPLTWVPFFCFWSLRKWVFLPSRKGSHHIITIIHSFKV